MAAKLKKLCDQVMVITGASSGIGLATAEAAARKGVKLVLAARSAQTLAEIARRFSANGAQVISVPCDVAERSQVERVAGAAIAKFGRIDTWVNVAGLGLYGRLDEVSEEDSRRLFDVNFWGVVNGSLAALPHLKTGGALINVGSEVSEAYVPLLGMYTATKHAVKGFTDSLRIEVERLDRLPISITLVEPTAVDTPFPEHARNYMKEEAELPSPMIEPEEVAEAILDAAVTPTRHKRVGTMARVNTTLAMLAPGLADRMGSMLSGKLHGKEPARNPEGALNRPSEATVAGKTRGKYAPKNPDTTLLTQACFGATGGFLGTLVIHALMGADQKWLPATVPPVREEPGEFMVKEAEKALPDEVRSAIPRQVEKAAAQGLGMGYGVTFGALYSALRPEGGNALIDGAALGLGCWAAGYLGWMPALGLTPPVHKQKPLQVAGPIANHVAYGVVTVAACDWLSRMFKKAKA